MSDSKLSPAIRSALSELRWRIRAYVLADGLALAAIWIGLTFWLGLALDYLPVLTWASEIPRGVRAVLLIASAGVLAWILFHYVLRRLLVRLRDRSMALLVERKFKGFSDELVTAVELTPEQETDLPFDEGMLERTRVAADEHVQRLRLADIFNSKPLVRNAIIAMLLLVPIVPFALMKPDTMKIWVQRFYLLKDVSWPRDTMVQVIGFQPQRRASAKQEGMNEVRSFGKQRSMKIAKGSSGTLRVRAKSRSGKDAPKYCTVYYRSADGVRSSVKMNKVGRLTRDGFQEYSLASKPFKGVLEDLDFDIVANDRRLPNYELEVVESPLIVGASLHCEFPDYLVDEDTSSWLPRDMQYVPSGTSLPMGTDVTLTLTSSKNIDNATMQVGEEGAPLPMRLRNDRTMTIEIPSLAATNTLYINMTDDDGVEMDRPAKFVIGAIKDNPPELDVVHRGISTMVTADVLIPIQGTAKDDYLVDRAWFELVTPDGRIHNFNDIRVSANDGTLTGGLDLRSKRGVAADEGDAADGGDGGNGGDDPTAETGEADAAVDDKDKIELKPGDRITVTAMAADRFNLGNEQNVGVGVRMDLEVVTPQKLLTSLDQRELAQRKVFEHVIEEMTAARDDLARVHRDLMAGDKIEVDPGEEVDVEQLKRRAAALRLLRIQQAGLQSEKSAQETAAVAGAFEDIVLELRNNRVDSQDRQGRLTSKVSEPLALIADTMFPELDNRLEQLEETLQSSGDDQDDEGKEGVAAAKKTLDQVDDILAEMNKVLQDILDIES